MLIWLIMFLSTLIFPFYLFNFKTTSIFNFWLFIFIYCLYQVGLFYFSLKALFWLELRGACCFIITCENTRIAMKVHSFVRENFFTNPTKMSSKTTEQNCDNLKNSDVSESVADPQNSTKPSLTHFVYFMFCPALLYRHSYPMYFYFNFFNLRGKSPIYRLSISTAGLITRLIKI
ncbi:unnamed protein product [Meloidogyne enterolobii]|uniref:Uncharacterized protein n=1 Tax=Meloidogyne enterolobii TaxID=390850 RepID=A0ACB1A3T5_MELEN